MNVAYILKCRFPHNVRKASPLRNLISEKKKQFMKSSQYCDPLAHMIPVTTSDFQIENRSNLAIFKSTQFKSISL